VSDRGSVVALTTDLLFATRIGEAARAAERPCQIVRSAAALGDALLAAPPPSLVLIDLFLPAEDVECALAAARAARPAPRLVAFGSHVDREVLASAEAHGTDAAWPRSLFLRRLAELLRDAENLLAADFPPE
jgi:DNA-binding NarL/FixJ family response regulator